jgi:hypothetical protein
MVTPDRWHNATRLRFFTDTRQLGAIPLAPHAIVSPYKARAVSAEVLAHPIARTSDTRHEDQGHCGILVLPQRDKLPCSASANRFHLGRSRMDFGSASGIPLA